MDQEQSTNKWFIKLLEDGSFENVTDRSLYVEKGDTVRVILTIRDCDSDPWVVQHRHEEDKDKLDPRLKDHFDGRKYFAVKMLVDTQGDYYCETVFNHSGSQFFRLVYIKDQKVDRMGIPNYFIVQPKTALEAFTIQTLLPYSVGPFKEWRKQIESQIQLGYRAFHFPPVQELGESGSLYAIKDQLKLNPDLFGGVSQEQLKAFFDELHNKYQAYFLVDILMNHTSFDSEWINKPEFADAVYNETNTPGLACAIDLDRAIGNFSNSIGNKQVQAYPKGNIISTEEDLGLIMSILENDVIRPLKLEEYFRINPDEVINEIQKRVPNKLLQTDAEVDEDDDYNIFIKNPKELFTALLQKTIHNKGAKRFGVSFDYDILGHFLKEPKNHKGISVEYIRQLLDRIDQEGSKEGLGYINEAINATRGQIRWEKVTSKKNVVEANAKGDSLTARYFTLLKNGKWAANNGWISGYDPMKNFAESEDHNYLRRTIFAWGDLVKLRFGNSKKDSLALWKFMKKYVQDMAKCFHGLRLDNAHGTPIHVGEYLMRKARKTTDNILIFAELFTGSIERDTQYTKQLGLNALVREIHTCNDGNSLNGALHFFSGNGKWAIGTLPEIQELYDGEQYKLLRPWFPPSLVYEQSHDNESLVSSRGFKQLLPVSALVSMSKCTKGTVRGYDQYLPFNISVVTERRTYGLDTKESQTIEGQAYIAFRLDLSQLAKMVEVRGTFNDWKGGLLLNKVDNMDPNVFSYVLSHPISPGYYEFRYMVDGEWYNVQDKETNQNGNHSVTIAEQKWIKHFSLGPVRLILTKLSHIIENEFPYIHVQNHYDSLVSIVRSSKDYLTSKMLIAITNCKQNNNLPVIELPGLFEKLDFILVNGEEYSYEQNDKILSSANVTILEHQNLHQYADIYYNPSKRVNVLKFIAIPVSLVIVVTCVQEKNHQEQLSKIEQIDFYSNQLFEQYFKQLSVNDINYLLFSSEQEERERTGFGLYYLENYRNLIYAGFYGPLSPVREACRDNNLGHTLCENIRNGMWLLDYMQRRCEKLASDTAQPLVKFINEVTFLIENIPQYLRPLHFCRLVEGICFQTQKRSLASTQNWMKEAPFVRNLVQASYQFMGILPSAQVEGFSYSMSAGHPHFSSGWARVWGRDTFISFKGIVLIPGMYKEGKEILLSFASCLRHGLLPNLLDGGRQPRYNNRDACWWFIKALRDYIEITGDSGIWKEKVKMAFLDNDKEVHYQKLSQGVVSYMSMQDVVQNIFESHVNGIMFREWKAGREIDEQMDSEGFNVQLKLDEETGFIVGGNWRNCLTWMDKMGSSEKAGNKGYPATSRDGAPIEMTALLKLALDFVIKQHHLKLYDYDGVKRNNSANRLTFKQWNDYIIQNFERFYWIPAAQEYSKYVIVEKYVRHKQIYKDLVKSSKPRNEYQLRCNACIAIAIVPELFNKQHAAYHLATTEAALLEPNSIGIKTLDKIATEFLPYYDNADDSNHFKTAQGFSYHNGPEWVWVYGYYLKAISNIHKVDRKLFYSYLTNHKKFILENEWYSLPEMTNGNGGYNQFSCRAQAWSISTVLEAIYDYSQTQQQ